MKKYRNNIFEKCDKLVECNISRNQSHYARCPALELLCSSFRVVASGGGQWCLALPFEIGAPHFTFGPRLLHTSNTVFLKCAPPFWTLLLVFGPPCCWILATSLSSLCGPLTRKFGDSWFKVWKQSFVSILSKLFPTRDMCNIIPNFWRTILIRSLTILETFHLCRAGLLYTSARKYFVFWFAP